MNFPHATADQWTAAQRILRGILSRHGVYGPDADDAVQQWTFKAMTKKHRKVCPVSPTAAAAGMKRLVAKYGIGRLLRETQPQAQTYARPVGRTGLDESQPDHVFDVAPGKAPTSINPATMAEAGESLAERMPRFAQRARARGMTPAALALVAAGWGPLDDEDAAKASPSVPQCGPGYTPPGRGCPGLHASRRPTGEPMHMAAPVTYLDGVNLTAYRAELARYYGR
jgi:hypothetical protein